MAWIGFKNETGDIELHAVSIPWMKEFEASSGSFAYFSVQNLKKYGSLRPIYVDGTVLQKESSDGFAIVSGLVK